VIPIEAVTFPASGGVALAEGTAVTPGMNVRPAGSTVKAGETLVRAGVRLRPFDLAALTLGGVTEVETLKKPVVAFIPTGSELIPAGRVPSRGETVDSNSVMAFHMLSEMGAEPLGFPIVRDDPAALRAALVAAARGAGMILVNGGSSKGGVAFNAAIISEMGEPLLHWIASAPGRPMCAAILRGKPLINIPGPPLAAYFVLDWCVTSLVARYYGMDAPRRKTVRARLTEDVGATPGMEILRKLDLRRTDGGLEAAPYSARGGSAILTLTAPAQLVTDGGTANMAAGETIDVQLLRD
jgi:molybdopterin molybdotransferase/putative molybdopterin biosynthesis protein